jgi:hypothetical protein
MRAQSQAIPGEVDQLFHGLKAVHPRHGNSKDYGIEISVLGDEPQSLFRIWLAGRPRLSQS